MEDKSEQEAKKSGGGELNIEFMADSMNIYGPKSDGGFRVSFSTGEYEQLNISKLMAISQHSIIKVKVTPHDE